MSFNIWSIPTKSFAVSPWLDIMILECENPWRLCRDEYSLLLTLSISLHASWHAGYGCAAGSDFKIQLSLFNHLIVSASKQWSVGLNLVRMVGVIIRMIVQENAVIGLMGWLTTRRIKMLCAHPFLILWNVQTDGDLQQQIGSFTFCLALIGYSLQNNYSF